MSGRLVPFVRCGAKCLAILFVAAIAAVVLGGSAGVSLEKLFPLFAIGGAVGLAVCWIHEKSRRIARAHRAVGADGRTR